jgi:hypothetical protein
MKGLYRFDPVCRVFLASKAIRYSAGRFPLLMLPPNAGATVAALQFSHGTPGLLECFSGGRANAKCMNRSKRQAAEQHGRTNKESMIAVQSVFVWSTR